MNAKRHLPSFRAAGVAILLCAIVAAVVDVAQAFSSPHAAAGGPAQATGRRPPARTGHVSLHMAPKFDKSTERWIATSPEETAEAGYGIGKTLLLQGPKPFFHRLFQPDDYEQAVLKFMAVEKVSREQAQGNMDAYLEST